MTAFKGDVGRILATAHEAGWVTDDGTVDRGDRLSALSTARSMTSSIAPSRSYVLEFPLPT